MNKKKLLKKSFFDQKMAFFEVFFYWQNGVFPTPFWPSKAIFWPFFDPKPLFWSPKCPKKHWNRLPTPKFVACWGKFTKIHKIPDFGV